MRRFGNSSTSPAGPPASAQDRASAPRRDRTRLPRNYALALMCVLLATGGSGAIAYALLTAPTPPPQPTVAQAGTLDPASSGHDRVSVLPPHMSTSRPIRVSIPSIGVDAAIDLLGLNKDGTVEVPGEPAHAGWYSGSATPGQIGSAVLLGHVDFVTTGPAVFYRLGELEPGAAVLVAREDGTTAQFTVNAVREYPKSNFPTQEVYGPVKDSAQLRLITCGSWDSDQHAYTGNTVVFATLAAPRTSASTTATPRATGDVGEITGRRAQ